MPPPSSDTAFFGHPRGLRTLFFTEMWERFSYYGMRALLMLFMTAAVADGGLGFGPEKAGPIYAMYTALVYLTAVPGGWLADNFLGQRRAVLYGGIVIMCGHILLAMHGLVTFFCGLGCVIVGTGLLKPNISVIVGQLYTEQDRRRDSAFSIFYMGINLGAFLAPLACGFLAQSAAFRSVLARYGLDPLHAWHWGFGAAAVGMFFGLVQYLLTSRHLGEAGQRPVPPKNAEEAARRRRTLVVGVCVAVFVAALLVWIDRRARYVHSIQYASTAEGLIVRGQVAGSGEELALNRGRPIALGRLERWLGEEAAGKLRSQLGDRAAGTVADVRIKVGGLNTDNIKLGFSLLLLGGMAVFFGRLFLAGEWTRAERARLVTIFVLFCAAAVFWGLFEQAGSTLTLFADRSTDNSIFGFAFPSSWWQSANGLLIILLAPVFAWLWLALGPRDLSYTTKFAIGLLLAGLGFAVLMVAAMAARGGALVSPLWLFAVYVLHTTGELCLSPVGLSSMTRLAPARVVSLMMGVWFLALAVGNFLGGSVSGFYEQFELPALFGLVAASGVLMALVMAALVVPINRMMARSQGGAGS